MGLVRASNLPVRLCSLSVALKCVQHFSVRLAATNVPRAWLRCEVMAWLLHICLEPGLMATKCPRVFSVPLTVAQLHVCTYHRPPICRDSLCSRVSAPNSFVLGRERRSKVTKK